MFPQIDAYYLNKQQLIGCITTAEKNDEKILFIVIDSNTENILYEAGCHARDIQPFVDTFPTSSNYKNNVFKAFIVNLFGLNLQSTSDTALDEYCKELKEKINGLGIPSYFISVKNYLYSTLLIATNVEANIDEEIAVFLPSKVGFTVGRFKFTSDGYKLTEQKKVAVDFKAKPAIIKQQIFGNNSYESQRIILFLSACPKRFQHQKIFKSMNYLTYNCCLACRRVKVIGEICKWLLDQSYSKYHILPFCNKDVKIYGKYGTEKNTMELLSIEVNDPLPITKTAIVAKSMPEFHISTKYNHGFGGLYAEVPKDCHRFKIILTVNEDNLEECEWGKKLYIDNLNVILSTFDKLLKETKIPVIGFFDNSSLIAVHKSDKGYGFLYEWNGVYGNDIYISFHQKKPQFGKNAMDALKAKNTFVVYDLLKIMSMPPNDIKATKHWGFTIINGGAANPVLLDFNRFDGTRKAASPSFLMAMSLRQHFKAIESECGEKPKKIGFFILEDQFNKEEMKRIHDGLEAACELLKVECVFIETERPVFI